MLWYVGLVIVVGVLMDMMSFSGENNILLPVLIVVVVVVIVVVVVYGSICCVVVVTVYCFVEHYLLLALGSLCYFCDGDCTGSLVIADTISVIG